MVNIGAVAGNDKVCGITAFLTTAYAILPQMSRSYVVFGKVITLPFTTYIFKQLAMQEAQKEQAAKDGKPYYDNDLVVAKADGAPIAASWV